jgi:hypothetical protein
MENISETRPIADREIFYHRQRQKNRIFSELTSFYAEEAEGGASKRKIAQRLKKDPAQLTRWLAAPSNLTLDTISDLLLALDAEMDYRIVRFRDRETANEMHPLIEQIIRKDNNKPPLRKPPVETGTTTAEIRIDAKELEFTVGD